MRNGEALSSAASLYVYPDNGLIAVMQGKSRFGSIETMACNLEPKRFGNRFYGYRSLCDLIFDY